MKFQKSSANTYGTFRINIWIEKKLKHYKHLRVWLWSGTINHMVHGCWGPRSEDECVLRLDDCNTIFQAEVLAIKAREKILLARYHRQCDMDLHLQSGKLSPPGLLRMMEQPFKELREWTSSTLTGYRVTLGGSAMREQMNELKKRGTRQVSPQE